jgi:flavin-dependent dehydrogenase
VSDDVIVNVFDRRGRAAGIFPTNDGLANVWVALPPHDYEREVRGDIRGAYHRLVAENPTASRLLGGATPAGGYRSFPGVPGYLRRAHGPGWALVGDAGYWKDPVSAHGITDAMISAELLADALSDVLLEGADPGEALGGYERRRDAGATALMPPTARLAAMDLDGPAAMLAFREIAGALRREVEELEERAVAAS